METICFYDDPELLFSAFDCKTQEQCDEIIKMMITLEILQSQLDSFFEVYEKQTGIKLDETDASLDNFNFSLKPAVCITLAKEFYENLALLLLENEITANDFFSLLNLFEGHINQHLGYDVERKKEINQSFISAYTEMRTELFEILTKDNPSVEFFTLYNEYEISYEQNLINADLEILPKEKRDLLLERAGWLNDENGLGKKVIVK